MRTARLILLVSVVLPAGLWPLLVPGAADPLVRMDGRTPWQDVCDALSDPTANKSPRAVARLLAVIHEGCVLHRNRPRSQVQQIRAAAFLALASHPPTAEVQRAVGTELTATDDALLFAAACRCVDTGRDDTGTLLQALRRPFGGTLEDAPVRLDNAREPTTAAREAEKVLDRFAALRGTARADLLPTSCCCAEPPQASAWQPPEARPASLGGVRVATSHGEQTLADFRDRPLFVTFFYSRCDNPRKCHTTLQGVRDLETELFAVGLADKVRVLVVTFDPSFDDLPRLARFAKQREFVDGGPVVFARPDAASLEALVRDHSLPVALDRGAVTTHGGLGLILDRQGKVCRTYHGFRWDVEMVRSDLARLTTE